MKYKLFIILIITTLIPLVLASTFNDCSIYGNCNTNKLTTSNSNSSLFNTNDSTYWNGHSFVYGAVSSIESDPSFNSWYGGGAGVCIDGDKCGYI